MTIKPLLSLTLLSVACTSTPKADINQGETHAPPVDDVALRADAHLSAALEREVFNGVAMVATCDDIRLHKAYGVADHSWDIPLTPDAAFPIASITKQFTASIILQLVEEGRLDLEAPITAYLKDYPADIGDEVTIHHLLSNTSGIPNLFLLEGAQDKLLKRLSPTELLGVFSKEPLEFTPGEAFHYSNSNFDILGVIIEELTGMSYADAVQERIVTPLGLTNTGYRAPDLIIPHLASGYNYDFGRLVPANTFEISSVYSAGGMYATAQDLHTFNCALHSGKVLKDASSIEAMLNPRLEGSDYGYGQRLGTLEVGERTLKVTGHSGDLPGFGLQNLFIPGENLSVIVLANNTGGDSVARANELVQIYFNQDVDLPKRDLERDLLQAYSKGGVDATLERYKHARESEAETYSFDDTILNIVGYRVLFRGDMEGALRVFTLNTELYPEEFNVWDSLGEAYFEAGDLEKAKANYEKSLELNPESKSGPPMLEKIEAKLKGEE